jgi:hypothetical protein
MPAFDIPPPPPKKVAAAGEFNIPPPPPKKPVQTPGLGNTAAFNKGIDVSTPEGAKKAQGQASVKTEPSILPGVTVTAKRPTEGAINLPPVPEKELQAGIRTLPTPPSITTPSTETELAYEGFKKEIEKSTGHKQPELSSIGEAQKYLAEMGGRERWLQAAPLYAEALRKAPFIGPIFGGAETVALAAKEPDNLSKALQAAQGLGEGAFGIMMAHAAAAPAMQAFQAMGQTGIDPGKPVREFSSKYAQWEAQSKLGISDPHQLEKVGEFGGMVGELGMWTLATMAPALLGKFQAGTAGPEDVRAAFDIMQNARAENIKGPVSAHIVDRVASQVGKNKLAGGLLAGISKKLESGAALSNEEMNIVRENSPEQYKTVLDALLTRQEDVRPSEGATPILEGKPAPEQAGIVQSKPDANIAYREQQISDLMKRNPSMRRADAEAMVQGQKAPESRLVKPQGEITRTGEQAREIPPPPPRRIESSARTPEVPGKGITPLEKPIPAIEEKPIPAVEKKVPDIKEFEKRTKLYKPELALGLHQNPFITPDGLLTPPYTAHSDLVRDYNGTRDIQGFMNETGYVRLKGEGDAINVEMVNKPTSEQFETIETASPTGKIRWDITGPDGKIRKSGEADDLETFKQQMDRETFSSRPAPQTSSDFTQRSLEKITEKKAAKKTAVEQRKKPLPPGQRKKPLPPGEIRGSQEPTLQPATQERGEAIGEVKVPVAPKTIPPGELEVRSLAKPATAPPSPEDLASRAAENKKQSLGPVRHQDITKAELDYKSKLEQFGEDAPETKAAEQKVKDLTQKYEAAKKPATEPLPEFKSSEEAVEFGRKYPERIPELEARANEATEASRSFKDEVIPGEERPQRLERLNQAMQHAVRAQLAHEAIDFAKNPKRETPIEKIRREEKEAAIPKPQAPKEKQPWEQTKAEYIKANEGEIVPTPGERSKQRQSTKEERAYAHKNIVASAIERGESIPESVLKDYPDLALPKEKAEPTLQEKAEPLTRRQSELQRQIRAIGEKKAGRAMDQWAQVRASAERTPDGRKLAKEYDEVSRQIIKLEEAETKPEPLTQSKLEEAAQAAPKAGLSLKEQKKTLLGELDKAKEIVGERELGKVEKDLVEKTGMNLLDTRQEISRIDNLSNATRKQRDWKFQAREFLKAHEDEIQKEIVDRYGPDLKKAGLKLDDEGRIVVDVPGDGTFHTPIGAIDEYANRIEKGFPKDSRQAKAAPVEEKPTPKEPEQVAPKSPDLKKRINSLANENILNLSGSRNAESRRKLLQDLTGEKVSKSEAGIGKLRDALAKSVGIEPTESAINKWLRTPEPKVEPPKPPTPQEIAAANEKIVSEIPPTHLREIEVDTKVFDEESGKVITEKRPAKEALEALDADSKLMKAFLDCVKGLA